MRFFVCLFPDKIKTYLGRLGCDFVMQTQIGSSLHLSPLSSSCMPPSGRSFTEHNCTAIATRTCRETRTCFNSVVCFCFFRISGCCSFKSCPLVNPDMFYNDNVSFVFKADVIFKYYAIGIIVNFRSFKRCGRMYGINFHDCLLYSHYYLAMYDCIAN